jgi:hypothetical protein
MNEPDIEECSLNNQSSSEPVFCSNRDAAESELNGNLSAFRLVTNDDLE